MGDDLAVVVQTKAGGPPETVVVHVDGIDAAVTEFPPRSGTGDDTVWATPAFNAHHPELAATVGSALRLDHGAQDLPSVQAEISRLAHGRPTESFGVDAQSAGTQRAIHLQAVALWILAGLLGLAALLITSQLLARQSTMESEGYRELRALGMTTRQIWAVGMARAVLIAVVASTVGVVVAAALSPVFPIGLAAHRRTAPGLLDRRDHPGHHRGPLGAGHRGRRGLAELARRGRPRRGPSEPTEAGMGRSRAAALARTSGAPATMVAGIGFALERGRGRFAGPDPLDHRGQRHRHRRPRRGRRVLLQPVQPGGHPPALRRAVGRHHLLDQR